MRLFQNIPGADTVYVNAYALQTPRLGAFKQVAPNQRAKKWAKALAVCPYVCVPFNLRLKTIYSSKIRISFLISPTEKPDSI